MVWVKKGLCGVDIRKQTYTIGVLYILLGILGLVYGFLLIGNPERVFDRHEVALEEKVQQEKQEEIQVAESNDTVTELESGDVGTEESYAYQLLLYQLQKEGVEIVLVAMITIGFSILLMVGVYKNKSVLLLPWLVQQTVELLIGSGMFVVYAIAGAKYSFLQIVAFVVSFVCAAYVNYAVLSHYILMRRMDKHSNQVISSVMNGESYSAATGVNYHRLQEEVNASKEMTTISSAVNNSSGNSGINDGDTNSGNQNADLFSAVVRMPPPPTQNNNTQQNDSSRRDDIMYFSID